MDEHNRELNRGMTVNCLMIGVGSRPFIDDWALAASSVARVYGMKSVPDRRIWRLSPSVHTVVSEDILRYDVHIQRVRGAGMLPRLAEEANERAILSVVRKIEETGGTVDLIHSHFYAASAGVPRAAKTLGIPYVHTEHSSWLLSPNRDRTVTRTGIRFLHRLAAHASTMFVVSDSLREAMVALGIDARYEVLGNPVDTSLFSVQPCAHGASQHLITIGGLMPHKRHELLIRAFARVLELDPESTFTIIGDGPLRQHLEALAARLNITSHIRFTGEIGRADVAQELRGADLYVHGSIVETFGVSIVEALLSGLPVVTTACGGVLGAIPRSLPTTVVDSASPDVFAAAIRAALAGGARLDRSAVAKTAAERFGLAPASNRLQVAYDAAVRA